MPNWVYNTIYFNSLSHAQYVQVKSMLKTEKDTDGVKRTFDFNKLIPMPEELNIESGYTGEFCKDAYNEYLDKVANNEKFIDPYLPEPVKEHVREHAKEIYKKEALERILKERPAWNEEQAEEGFNLAAKYTSNMEKYGFKDFFDWHCTMWGTKWNACDIIWDDSSQRVDFNTAWNMPEPIFKELSRRFDITIDVYVEEEGMAFKGEATYSNGECIRDEIYEPKVNEYGYEIDDSHTEPRVGDYICIRCMNDEPDYEAKTGWIELIDDVGQLHGTWGGCAIIPGTDEFDIIKAY